MEIILTSPTNPEKTVTFKKETVALVNETYSAGKYFDVVQLTVNIAGQKTSVNLTPSELARAVQLLVG